MSALQDEVDSLKLTIEGHEAFAQELRREIDRLNALVYVPGMWRCPRCQFTLLQRNLNAVDGTVTARDEAGDKCPNCAGPLWRVSERDNNREQAKMSSERIGSLLDALRKIAAYGEPAEIYVRAFKLQQATAIHCAYVEIRQLVLKALGL